VVNPPRFDETELTVAGQEIRAVHEALEDAAAGPSSRRPIRHCTSSAEVVFSLNGSFGPMITSSLTTDAMRLASYIQGSS
jgi:hypothetical protein